MTKEPAVTALETRTIQPGARVSHPVGRTRAVGTVRSAFVRDGVPTLLLLSGREVPAASALRVS